MFDGIVEQAYRLFINEVISDRLKSAMQKEEVEEVPVEDLQEEPASKIVTTVEELEGFQIIRALLCRHVEVNRIVYRDTQSYFSVLLDNTNRKTICRLFLEGRKKSMIVIFADKSESARIPIESLTDIFQHEELLLKSLKSYIDN